MEILNKIKRKFLSDKNLQQTDGSQQVISPKQIQARQIAMLIIIGLVIGIFGYTFFAFPEVNSRKVSSSSKEKNKVAKTINVEVASKSLDPERMWRNHFEDKLEEAQVTTNEQLAKISESIDAKSGETLTQTQDDIRELKEQLMQAREDMQEATYALREAQLSQKDNSNYAVMQEEENLRSTLIENDEPEIDMPKDSKLYIPATSFVRGKLLGGISVSTSIGSSSEPVPVIIRVTDKGNLPDNFAANLKDCRILGSAYGDLSSERAIIRAESLVCVNNKTEEIIVTNVAGQIHGDDGMNGIKGKVVDMSTKHIKNAAIGGMISGLAGTMKEDQQMVFNPLGSATVKRDFNERVKDNSMAGAGKAAEKIADYYIKQAENMSPVLLIAGGRRVDIVFTKGVHLGSSGVVKEIEKVRKNLAKD